MSARRRAVPTAPPDEAPAGARWGQRVLLAGGVLAFWPSLALPYYTPKSLCCAAGLAAAWLFLPRARRAPLSAPIAALLAVAAVSALRGADPWQSFWGDPNQSYYGLLQLVLYALAYRLGASAGDALVEDGLAALAAAAVVCGGVAAAQAAGLVPAPFSDMLGRVDGPTGNPVFFGAVAAALLAPALAGWRRGGWRRLAPAAAVLALALARARGAWIAAAAGAGAWLLGSGRLAKGRRAVLAALAAAAVAGGLRLGTPTKLKGDTQRLETWRVAVQSARERPLLGWGPDDFRLAFRRHESDLFASLAHQAGQGQSSAHNDLLQAAATLGVLGLAAYLWLLAACAWSARRAFEGPRAELAAAAAGGLLAAFITLKVDPLPLEGCAVVAWLAGTLAPRGEPAPAERRWLLAGLSAAVLAGFAALAGGAEARLAGLDALKRGDFERGLFYTRLAGRLAPGRFPFEDAYGEALATAARYQPQSAPALAARGLELGRRSVRRHPGNPAAYELAGSLTLLDARLSGDKALYAEARAALQRAAELDPHQPFTAQKQLELARAMGDKQEEARAQARLDELEKLEGPAPATTR